MAPASSSSAHNAVLTVGSTRFDPLVSSFLQPAVLAALSSLGITHVLAQVGNSELPAPWTVGTHQHEGLEVEVVKFSDQIEREVGSARVVVSHAGAGSILSFLRPSTSSDTLSSSSTIPRASSAPRTLVLVPNSTLMDSHQTDLAEEMRKEGWAVVCDRTEDLEKTLQDLAKTNASATEEPPKYPELDTGKVQRILDETLGYL